MVCITDVAPSHGQTPQQWHPLGSYRECSCFWRSLRPEVTAAEEFASRHGVDHMTGKCFSSRNELQQKC